MQEMCKNTREMNAPQLGDGTKKVGDCWFRGYTYAYLFVCMFMYIVILMAFNK